MEELVLEDSLGEELMEKESIVGDLVVAVRDSVLERSVAKSETGGIARIVVIWPFSKLTCRPYLVSR